MKTRELIESLQRLDPEGDLPVVVDGVDIYFAEVLPGYYDGAYQQLVHDENLRGKAWSIIGGTLTRHGEKLVLHSYPISSVMVDNPDLPVQADDGYCTERVAKWRKEARQIIDDVDSGLSMMEEPSEDPIKRLEKTTDSILPIDTDAEATVASLMTESLPRPTSKRVLMTHRTMLKRIKDVVEPLPEIPNEAIAKIRELLLPMKLDGVKDDE